MTTTINVRTPTQLKQAYARIAKGVASPFKSTRRMFMGLGAMVDRDTMLTFKKEGSYQGRVSWPKFSNKTLKTDLGTWKLRYGTDKSPKRTSKELAKYKTEKGLWYKPGPMVGYRSDRRYSTSSKLLQASGSFKNSFRIIKIGAERMKYGTSHKLGKYIMSNPTRQAIQYTKNDERRYSNLIYNWWFKNTKI